MDKDCGRFRVLLAEDDPVSREFLAEGIRACGAEVKACADGDSALTAARSQTWDLLVFDHHLPGQNGDAVLTALRTDAAAASHATPAIATSATRDDVLGTLLHAGFTEVLPKPMQIETLREALLKHGCPAASPLDDDDALRACGSPRAVAHLRRLFADEELPKVQDELNDLGEDPQTLRPTLHRLNASCGFCGAHALAHACADLHRALASNDSAQVQTALAAFRGALAATRAALRGNCEADS
jgi:CheY-like chemotaxis protein